MSSRYRAVDVISDRDASGVCSSNSSNLALTLFRHGKRGHLVRDERRPPTVPPLSGSYERSTDASIEEPLPAAATGASAHDRAAIIRRALEAATPRILYVAGAGRSGSTLLGMVLGALPGCTHVGELRHVWERGVLENRLCGCGAAFSDCPFWTAVGERAFGGWSTDDARAQVRRLWATGRQRHFPLVATGLGPARFRAEARVYGELQERVYAAVAAVCGTPVIVDTSKSPIYALTLRAQALDVRVIHLVRDSRAVAYSWTRTKATGDSSKTEYMPTFHPGHSTLTWISNNVAIDAVALRGLRPRVLRYEHLVSAPARELERSVADLLPETARAALPDLADPEFAAGTQHTVAGNPMRMRTGPLKLRLDDAWRSEMRPADRLLVSAMTFPLLLRYGYDARA